MMNTKAHILILAFWVCAKSISMAQTPQATWLDYQDDANGEGRIFKTDYGFITFCGYVPLENNNLGVLVTGLSPDHEVIFTKPLSSLTANYAMYLGQSVIAASDSGYCQMVFNSSNEEDGFPMLVRYNDFGDTLWTRKYFLNDPWEYRDFVLTQDQDNNLYLAGTHNLFPFDSNSDVPWKQVILKLDAEGNLMSSTEYNGFQSIWNYSIIATDDALITGGRMCQNINDILDQQFRDYIHKCNYDGTSEWLTKIQVPPAGAESGIFSLLPLNNGNYLYVGGRSNGTLSGSGETSNTDTQPTIGEIENLTGDTLYERGYHDHEESQQLFSLKKLSGGGYIGVGIHMDYFDGPSEGWPIGFMLKLDENLNEVWYRYYVPSIWEGMGRWNNLTDVLENENGTYTAVGLLYTNTGDGPQNGFIQDTYLITVDSLGCLIEGCDVGITEYVPIQNILVYPNPTSNLVNIQFPHHDSWNILIYDNAGRLVSEDFKTQTRNMILDLMELQTGLYHVIAISKAGKQFNSKISKQ